MLRPAIFAGIFAASAALVTSAADANGRYPSAQFFVVGEGAHRDRIALVTTFGLVTSVDGGRSWNWVCEDAVGYTGQYDPAIAVTSNGTLVSSLPDGLSRTSDGDWCNWSRPSSFPTEPVSDVASVGSTIVASVSPPAAPQFVVRSEDHGATWTRRWQRAEFYAHTIDLAPSDLDRVYTTGWVRGAFAALFRSNDGGGDFVEATRAFDNAYIAFISWVDPASADTLLLRADLDPMGTLLMRSDDGGGSFRTILRTSSSMVAAAATRGTRTIWASSTALAERIKRSDDGGETWVDTASNLRPRSLRFVNETLYATANEMTSGLSFACSRDRGESWTPMLVLNQLRGPEACPEGSSVRTRCAPLWDAMRAQLAMIARPPVGPTGTCDGDAGPAPTDAASSDAAQQSDSATDGALPSDAGNPLPDARADGGVPTDGGAYRSGGGCACSAAGNPAESRFITAPWLALCAAFALARSARQRRVAR